MKPASLFDSQGRPFTLGGQIGRGGEGTVYEVEGEPSLVAKLYHQSRLADDLVAKLQAVVSRWSPDLQAISAWPQSLVYKVQGKRPCGILMPRVTDGRHMHELYGTTNRRRHFPDALWHHLVLAARNAAAAFHTVHAAGVVIGDVNQGNLMVDPQMRVRLIDCDSFQVANRDRTFTCPVGTPHFTPPELQSQKLGSVLRTANHDAFGLAVLIFHLLFVGRHPFAGRYRGAGEMSIDKAISESRFAFSKNRATTLLDPPPASLKLDDLPEELARLFELAFCSDAASGRPRPAPHEWAGQLETLIKERATCSFDDLHVFYQGRRDCPWCRIEEEGGPAFFVPRDGDSRISTDRLAHFDRRVAELRPARFPDLPLQRLAPPQMPPLKRLATKPKWTTADTAVLGLAAAAALCLLGVFLAKALWVAAPLSLLSGSFLVWCEECRARRKRVVELLAELEQRRLRITKLAPIIIREHQSRARVFRRVAAEWKTTMEHYKADADELPDVLLAQRDAQKNAFLRSHLIREHAGSIPGITPSTLTMLESFGIESACDVDSLNLCGIPNISSSLTMELLQWRSLLESEQEFRPEHGVTVQDLHLSGESAARRFKLSQARKVLMGAKQVETLGNTGRFELERALARYDEGIAQWRRVAGQLRDFQSGRRPLERMVNRSVALILGVAVAIPLVSLLLRLLFG